MNRIGASLRVRVGRRVRLDARMDVAPLRLLSIGVLVASILLSVPPIIRAARERPRRLDAPAAGFGALDRPA